MFIGSSFLLILSHLDLKDLPFGRLTTFGAALFFNYCLFYHFLFLLPLPIIFLNIGFATSPNIRPVRDAISPIGIVPPFCFLFLFLYLPPIRQIPFSTDCFTLFIPKSLHHFDLLCKFYVLKLIRSLIKHINTLRECAQILTLKLKSAVSFKIICRFIFE